MRYNLAESTWGSEEILAGMKVLINGRCTMGEVVKEFEKQFSRLVGSKYAVMVNSGSSANLIMMAALKFCKNKYHLNDFDEVIVPAVSWSTTYYPIYQNRLTMRFVDINYDTFNIDENLIESAITEKTKAILAVNILGNSCNFNKLQEICDKHNLILLEDNCESLYASYNNKQCGTFGTMGTFSTFFSHHICTVEGGVVVTDDEELYQILLSLRAHGWTRELPQQNYIQNKTDNPGDNLFNFVLPGYNVRPNEIFAAIGLEQLKKLPSFIAKREDNYRYFENKIRYLNFKYNNIIKLQEITSNSKSSFFSFPFLLTSRMADMKKSYMRFLIENHIECRPIVAGNFTKNPVIQKMDCTIYGEMTNANIIDQYGMFIGNHPHDLKRNIDDFIEKTEYFINNINLQG